jgi:hypothetical protein
MKRAFFVLVFVLFSVAAFAQFKTGYLDTPEGNLLVQYGYLGKNCGQQTTDDRIKAARSEFKIETDIKLTTVKWDIIRSGLSIYEPHSRGDTYLFSIGNTSGSALYIYEIVIEYTSATQYTYWLWVGYR